MGTTFLRHVIFPRAGRNSLLVLYEIANPSPNQASIPMPANTSNLLMQCLSCSPNTSNAENACQSSQRPCASNSRNNIGGMTRPQGHLMSHCRAIRPPKCTFLPCIFQLAQMPYRTSSPQSRYTVDRQYLSRYVCRLSCSARWHRLQ